MTAALSTPGDYRDRTLALAGILQAVREVQDVAHRGRVDNAILATSVHSLLTTNPETAEEVVGGVDGVRAGLRLLQDQFEGQKGRDIELTRYLIALLHLERKIAKRADLLETISTGIERARGQAEHFSPTHANVIANLADIYSKTVSTLKPRVMVSGQHGHLSNPTNANLVRTLLLAGVRDAVLWRQCGGSRWQLLWKRRALLEATRRLLNEA